MCAYLYADVLVDIHVQRAMCVALHMKFHFMHTIQENVSEIQNWF